MSKHKFNRNFAIIIGINDYVNGIRELETAVPDAHKLAQILQKQHQNLKEQYQAQNKYEVQLLLNKRVTLSKLKELIEDFKQGQIAFDNEKVVVTESDRILFYFAGHGIALEALENQEGPVGYLIPQDATLGDSSTYLPMQELHDALNALSCRHLLAILDCCFAGAFRWASLKREILPKITVYKERYDRFISDAAWQVITSAADDQKALDSLGMRGEVKEGNEVHSPFAKALFDALCGTDKKADSNDDGIITATELYSYLRDQVEVVTEKHYKRQTPSLCPLRKHDKGEFIFLLPNFDRDKLEDAPPLTRENNPYRGLQSYDEKDNNLFFGRENLIEKLYQKAVANQQPLTLVLGASGTGKSSLMKAGLLHRLRHSQEHKFQILDPMRPGESPLQALAQVCLPIANTITTSQLVKDEQALANIVSKINPQIKLLLAVDQFEELITLCKSDEQREQFQKLIKNAIAKYPNKIHVVITVRLDFEAQFQSSILKDFWNDHTRFVVPPMTQDEFREVIEKPALEKVVYFDPPSLVDELINEVVQMPGALPLLSFTLSELYLKYLEERRDNRALKKEDYEELGRVVGSLTKRANQEYDQLVASYPAYQNTVRQVMLRMISLQGGDLARRQVPKSELIYPDQEESDRVQTVIKRFSQARLIVEGSNSQGEAYVEPAHDALVQGWDKLLKWKKEEDIILQRRLTAAAEEWESVASKKQPSGLLYQAETVIDWLDRRLYIAENLFSKINTRLVQGLQQRQNQQQVLREKPIQFLWNSNPYLDVLNQELQSHDNWFNQLETEFVQRSVLQKRRNISWRWRIAIAIMLGLSGLTVWALINLRQATINQMLSEKELADADLRSNEPILDALLNSLSAGESLKNRWLLKVPPPKEDEQLQVIRTLRKAVYTVKEYNRQEGFPSGVQSIFWEKDGRRRLLVVSTENDGTVRVWDKQAKKLAELPGNQYLVTQVIFSPDGSQLAIGTNKGTILFWDWQNQQQATVLQGHECEDPNEISSFNSCAITSLSFNQDGSEIVSVRDDGLASLWNFTSNQYQELQVPPNNIIMTAGFQPDGELLLVTKTPDGKSVSVFNSYFQELSKINQQFPVTLDQVILSPNSEEIAIIYGGGRSTVGSESYLWQWRQNYLQQLLGQNIDINFSQDGKKVAAAGFNDGTIRLKDLDSGIISELKGHTGQIANFNFRSDGKVLATASADGTLRLWSLEEQQPSQLEKLPEKINSITFSRDGKLIATQAVDRVVHLLDLSGNPVKQFNSQFPVFNSLRFSRNGKQLATLSQQGTVGILDLSSQQYREFPGEYDSSSNLSFSPDGKKLAVTGNDNNNKVVYLLDVSSVKPDKNSFPYAETISINNVVWKPDGQILLAGIEQLSKAYRSIVLLDLKSGKQLQTIPRLLGIGEFSNISTNNDGNLAAFVQEDGTVSLWYMDGSKMGGIQASDHKIKSVILSPDSSMVATISEDGTAKLWEIGKLDKLLTRGCDRLREYLQNNPNQSDRHLCNNLPSTPTNPNN
ncbi:caspase family protein [Nostoc sp. CHAB 5836]|uniref:nSTAND1 domain-containing NTPase n=1 Tax=Nostoc sp. CHAB 5836 TaxID=2780404 RepID=UPI001E30B18C|nr:caspase family protein [Nostoc sp. CHAB 5836]MCC5617167.1 caspase family protein [Nostoc sp. CHAB 5836]